MQKWLWGLVAVIALAAGLWLSASFKSTTADPVAALVYPTPRALTDFHLLDEQNQPVGVKDLQGHWTLIFVGYTHCPDICPMTMAKLAGMYQDLVKLTPEPLEIWFVSVDPKRDTPEQLAQYIRYFNQAPIKARTAEHKDLFPFIRQLGLMYAINDGSDASNSERYTVDHSASLALLNPQGAVVAMFKPEMKPGAVPLINNQQFLADYPLVIAAATR
ncbi:SCO family protein [Rheinheimera sp. 1928-s]|uniref:SCO family protein n=1 Tax=Rheinheimera sp. 1928-s TaxID=3033803 RepID=UPI00260896B7|nr:SCO family protein [Rheinheimera sp. 1928-s]MDF3126939.1 SCO family protein [Rheinheimera sp. 1928-s]